MDAELGPELEAALGPGDRIELTWGPETFTPIRYHSVTVGPITLGTTVRPRESPAQAWARLSGLVVRLAEREYATKIVGHLERVKASRGAREAARVRSEG